APAASLSVAQAPAAHADPTGAPPQSPPADARSKGQRLCRPANPSRLNPQHPCYVDRQQGNRPCQRTASATRRVPISYSTRTTRFIGGPGDRRRSRKRNEPKNPSCSPSATPPVIGVT